MSDSTAPQPRDFSIHEALASAPKGLREQLQLDSVVILTSWVDEKGMTHTNSCGVGNYHARYGTAKRYSIAFEAEMDQEARKYQEERDDD